jgi:renalase
MGSRVAIVGAGLSGVTAGRLLQERGHDVAIFEKSPGFGGRLATRRLDGGRVDHGAAFFTARTPAFLELMGAAIREGGLNPWAERLHRWDGRAVRADPLTEVQRRWAAPEGFASWVAKLCAGLKVHRDVRVRGAVAQGGGWRLNVTGPAGDAVHEAEVLVVAIPAPQVLPLFEEGALEPAVVAELRRVEFEPCLALLVEAGGAPPEWRGLVGETGPLQWAGLESSKRAADRTLLTLHGAGGWSRDWYDRPDEEVAEALLDALRAVMGRSLAVDRWQLKRWRYARPVRLATAHALLSERPPVVFCGDWAVAPRVEGAFLSGVAASERLIFGGWA